MFVFFVSTALLCVHAHGEEIMFIVEFKAKLRGLHIIVTAMFLENYGTERC